MGARWSTSTIFYRNIEQELKNARQQKQIQLSLKIKWNLTSPEGFNQWRSSKVPCYLQSFTTFPISYVVTIPHSVAVTVAHWTHVSTSPTVTYTSAPCHGQFCALLALNCCVSHLQESSSSKDPQRRNVIVNPSLHYNTHELGICVLIWLLAVICR